MLPLGEGFKILEKILLGGSEIFILVEGGGVILLGGVSTPLYAIKIPINTF